jgi:hypothetical protein
LSSFCWIFYIGLCGVCNNKDGFMSSLSFIYDVVNQRIKKEKLFQRSYGNLLELEPIYTRIWSYNVLLT